MPVPKRYFHCSQEINHDAEMWEFTTTFGDRAIRTWLQILAFLDRSENQWRVSGDWLGTLSRMVRQSSANCSRQVRWMVEKQWLQVGETAADGSPLVFKASNWRKYNRTQEHKRSGLTPDKGADRDPLLSYSLPTPTPKEDIRATAFDDFWKCYPRKKGKKAAAKAFLKATDKPPLDVLIAKLNQQKQSMDWKKDGGKYIPHPSTWLNEGRWDDEVDAPQKERLPL